MKKVIEALKQLPIREKIYLGIIVASIIGTFIYHFLNAAPQKWDSAGHMNLALLYAIKIKEFKLLDIFTLSGYYPPFVHLLGGLFYIFIPTTGSLLFLTLVIYVIGLVYLYKLAFIFLQDREKALLTCTIFSLFPQTFIEARLFQLDLPLTFLVVAAVYYLHQSHSFTKRKETILFFLFAAFAQLTKWYGFMFFIVPFAYEFMWKNKTDNYINSKKLINIGKGALVAFVLTASWYVINFKSILNFFGNVSSLGELSDPTNPLSMESLLEYFNLSLAFQISYFVFLIVFIGAIYLLIKRDGRIKYYLLSMILPWTVFTFIVNKDVRYIMPILPYYALLLSTFLATLEFKKREWAMTIAVILLGFQLFTYGFISFNQYEELPKKLRWFGGMYTSPGNKYKWVLHTPNVYSYSTNDWKIETLYDKLMVLDSEVEKNANIIFAVDYPYFNILEFTTLQLQNSTYYQAKAGYDLTNNEFVDDFVANPINHDFKYIVTSYDPGPKDLRHYENMVKINRFLQLDGNRNYQSVGSFKLPNQEEVYIFRKNDTVPPVEPVAPVVEENVDGETVENGDNLGVEPTEPSNDTTPEITGTNETNEIGTTETQNTPFAAF